MRRMLDVRRVNASLWIWTTEHPLWTPENDGWDAVVSSIYMERPDAIILIDPLVPIDPLEAERVFVALDRDVERRSVPVTVVCTVPWHRRSATLLRERYGGQLYASHADHDAVDGATVVSGPAEVAAAVTLHPLGAPGMDELVVRIDANEPTLVFGDAVVGRPSAAPRSAPELTISPLDWFEPEAGAWYQDELPRRLASLTEGVEIVIPSHGELVEHDGGAALKRALSAISS